MQSSIRTYVRAFRGNAAGSARRLRELYESDAGAFVTASPAIIKETLNEPGLQYLLTVLLRDGVILRWLCDPVVFSHEEAVRVVKTLRRVDPRLAVRLLSLVFPLQEGTAETLDEPSSLRVLQLIAAMEDGRQLLPVMARLLRHSSAKVRSKAALIVGRVNKNPKWVYRQLSEADARLRANALESLWGSHAEDARAVYWLALSDADNRVVGNALLGLYRLGEPASIAFLLQMAAHPDGRFRETSIWVMEQTEDPRFEPVLAGLMSSHPEHRGKILRALKTLQLRSKPSSIRIAVGRFEVDSETGSTKLNVAPLTKSGPIAGLLPTQFALWRDAVLVEDYEVTNIASQDPVSLVFIVPRSLDRPAHEALVKALRTALRYRRKGDAWSVLKYRNEKPAATVVVPAPSLMVTDILGLDLAVREQPAVETVPIVDGNNDSFTNRVSFSDDNDSIEDMLLHPGTHETSAPNVSRAVGAALNAMPAGHPARQVMLVLHEWSADLPTTDVERLAQLAQMRKTVIHTLALKPSEFGARLAAETGGQYIGSCDPERFENVLESFSAVIAGGYQLRFRSEDLKPCFLKVQLHTQEAMGELNYQA